MLYHFLSLKRSNHIYMKNGHQLLILSQQLHLERNEMLYKGLIEHGKKLLKSILELSFTHKTFGDIFSSIGAREPQPKANESFTKFGDSHRHIDKSASGTVSSFRSNLRF